ncbi:saccharopine dehydrogenase NADP-binding domain-containing protein [Saccharopolyspora phatthalungensis]|uniref:Saccharopine dehydrogenase NADP binding domain-containing protein n=1 Tax=Saccharopolyspora phatthalungensis TaxID=664693 RepID=A0A840QFX9_9PSEU|nr:saccharopine dehydrogenase NADP-binding domain-containing protein [Saccharopolyspora phatthalungensis]MBB5158991.1 hypothetical protein [Saccharopolyspora phatthalungensis]
MIALLGASGAVGGHVLAGLRARGLDVRTGSRQSGVDIRDDRSLAAFIDGARLVINCAGPSHDTAARVARAAVRVGADYVDAGGDSDDAMVDAGDRTVLFAAGASPGLSGLLPRWLAGGFDEVRSLTAYSGVLDRFTWAGAEDFLSGTTEPGAAWREGRRRSGALSREHDVLLPYFERPVVALPFLDRENEATARQLSLVDGQWYSVVENGHLLRALDRASGLPRERAVAAIRDAAALDVAGRSPHAILLIQLDGVRDRAPFTRTVAVRADSVAALTAAVTVAAAVAVLSGEVPPGANRAGEVLPASVVENIAGSGLTVSDASIAELAPAEEGVL